MCILFPGNLFALERCFLLSEPFFKYSDVEAGQESISGGYKIVRQAFQCKGLGTRKWYMLLSDITPKNLFPLGKCDHP